MNKDLANILSTLSPDVDQDTLLQYLNKELSNEQNHAIEAALAEDPFLEDALEGLSEFSDKAMLANLATDLNLALKQKLKEKNLAKEKKKIPNHDWLYYAIILILLLCVVGYVVIRKLGGW